MKKILFLMAIALPFILNSCGDNKDEPDTQEHEWVDLGLPSGTLWATCNVGASTPEEYGDYFAWGETVPKKVYNWETYKWCKGSESTLTKYCYATDFGVVDKRDELLPEDDAAYVNWGHLWRMPTDEQQLELIEKCSWTWTTRNSVNGRLATGPNGNSIFFPAAGDCWRELLFYDGSFGCYWSRTLVPYNSNDAFYLLFNSVRMERSNLLLYGGLPVRAVRASQN